MNRCKEGKKQASEVENKKSKMLPKHNIQNKNKKTYPERKQKQRKGVASNNGRKKIKVEEKEKYKQCCH